MPAHPPALDNFPIIDVHSHTFNARELPLHQIVHARFNDYVPWYTEPLLALGGDFLVGHPVGKKDMERLVDLLTLATPESWDNSEGIGEGLYLPRLFSPEKLQELGCPNEAPVPCAPGYKNARERTEQSYQRTKCLTNHLMQTLAMGVRRAGKNNEEGKEEFLQQTGQPTDFVPKEMLEFGPRTSDGQNISTEKRDRYIKRLQHLFEQLEKILAHAQPDRGEVADKSFGPHCHSQPLLESPLMFVTHLMLSDKEMYLMRVQHETPSVRLFVSLTHNMGPVYDQNPDRYPTHLLKKLSPHDHALHQYERTLFLRYDQQLERTRKLEKFAEGRMVHFVSWNPFESGPRHAADWCSKEPEALRIVKRAIGAGAMGVKYYPPYGVRPTGNGPLPGDSTEIRQRNKTSPFKREPNGFFERTRHHHWAARYEGWWGTDMDAVNETLYAYCEDKGIPIFTHCNTGEMKGGDGDEECADPYYWALVLKQHPRLRLCLGHAGGEGFWFDLPNKQQNKSFGVDKRQLTWGKTVFDLCQRYPNVYTEIGIHEEAANPQLAARFAARLGTLVNCAGRDDMGHSWKFGSKIMYGSDWFMPIQETPDRYLQGFRKIFLTQELRPYYPNFFARNAIAYLRLGTQAQKSCNLTDDCKQNIAALIQAANRKY